MSKTIKIALVSGGLTFLFPIVITATLPDLASINGGIIMSVSLILVLSIYSAIKAELFEELKGVYDRRPLFKKGITVAACTALLYSFGTMSSEVLFEEKLYELRIEERKVIIAEGEELIAEQKKGLEEENYIDKIQKGIKDNEEKLKTFKDELIEVESNGKFNVSLLQLGSGRLIFIMLFGAIYSFAIPFILKQSPQIKAINSKINNKSLDN
jgi:hypothetical protein